MNKEKKLRISRDVLFQKLIVEKGLDYAIEAGWYNDFYTNGEIINPLFETNITPIADVQALQQDDKPIIVLVTSGSFNPPHEGHVDSMRQAEDYMRSLGYNVVSYFSPSHDMYVSKKKGEKHIPAAERIELLNKMGVNVCPWESMFLEGDVIFTEVALRLSMELILKHKLKIERVLFVCGSDISEYIRPFENVSNLGALLIKRPGYEKEFYQEKEVLEVSDNANGLYFFDSESPIEQSSSNLLLNGYQYSGLKKKARVRVREGNEFDKRVFEVLTKYFDHVEPYYIKESASVRDYVGLEVLEHAKTISMDKFTKGDVNYSLSRVFDYFGMKCIGFNEEMLSDKVPEGFYILFDDDSSTGYMMNRVRETIEEFPGVSVQLLTTQIPHDPDYEIIDAYDFDFSCKDGGLKVMSPDRLPYILPFVNPTSRCNISRPFTFSCEIIELNKEMGNELEFPMKFDLLNKLKEVEQKYNK